MSSIRVSPPLGKNLLLKEQILPWKSGPYSKSFILQRKIHGFMLFHFVKLMKNSELFLEKRQEAFITVKVLLGLIWQLALLRCACHSAF